MTSEQFTYWLQGFAELHQDPPTAEQWQAIRDHLALVFDKRTPEYHLSTPTPWPQPNAKPHPLIVQHPVSIC